MPNIVTHISELIGNQPMFRLTSQDTNEILLKLEYLNPSGSIKDRIALEIIDQTQARFHAFVAAAGTGGTFSGVANVLKEKFPSIKCVAVEPATSAVLSGGEPGFHRIEGIGEGFIPNVMDTTLMDSVIQVTDAEAIDTTRMLWKKYGIMSGISGGANVAAAFKLQKTLNPGNIIVTIIPDSGCRYFSTPLFNLFQ